MTQLSITELYKRNKQPNTGGGTRLYPAIQENLKITAETGASEKSGNKYIDVTYINKDEKFHKDRVWFPNGKAFTKGEETQAEANERDLQTKRDRLGRLLAVVVPFEEVIAISDSEWETFDGLATNTAKLLNKMSDTNARADLKLIYDAEGKFAMIPTWKGEWLEVHVPGMPTKLTYNDYEANERMTRKSDSPASENLIVSGKKDIDYDIV